MKAFISLCQEAPAQDRKCAFPAVSGDGRNRSLPDAMVGPTPLRLQRACAEASMFPVFCNFLKAFFVSAITTLGVFIWIKFDTFG